MSSPIMTRHRCLPAVVLAWAVAMAPVAAQCEPTLRSATFDADPAWDAFRNQLLPATLPVARQDFGYRPERQKYAKRDGAIGGWIQRSVTPASFALGIEPKSFDDRLSASGTFAVTRAESGSGSLFGWFHHTSRGWRTPNSLAIRLDGNGGKYWVLFEYGTRHWRTGGKGTFDGIYQTTKTKPFLADGTPHHFTLTYDPEAQEGQGQVTLLLDGIEYVLPLETGHRADGAAFDRFGLWNVQVAGEGMDVSFADLSLDGHPIDLSKDPNWEGMQNQGEYPQRVVRPMHDFGFRPTAHAGGKLGELGGVVWRESGGTFCADRIGPLSLEHRLHAEGRLVMTAASADSAVCFGWFDAKSRRRTTAESVDPPPGPNSFGILLEGLSRDGHYFRPAYTTRTGAHASESNGPVVRPDAVPRKWSLDYDPDGADGRGEITYQLDEDIRRFPLSPGHRALGATFDRFGIYGWERADGGFVEIYLDDLQFTAEP